MPRSLLLINPNSRNGETDIEPALDMLRTGGLDLIVPPSGADFGEVLANVPDDIDSVIVGGGDGTLNAVAKQLLAFERPFGILPLGTANDLARTLDLPQDHEACARIIVEGHTRRIDLGEVNGKPFFNVASLGISTEAAQALSEDLKARLGVFGYPISLFKAAANRQVIKGEITIDDQRRGLRGLQISIGNGRYYGGGMIIAAEADIDDGMLDLVVVAPQPLLPRLHRLLMFRWGRHDLNDAVDHRRGKEIRIETRTELPINTDGEITTTTPATFRILSKALAVFVPRSNGS